MLSLVTISPVITAFHSCCLSHHVFDQVTLWPAWVGIETAIFWQCSPGTVETQRLYPLRHGPQRRSWYISADTYHISCDISTYFDKIYVEFQHYIRYLAQFFLFVSQYFIRDINWKGDKELQFRRVWYAIFHYWCLWKVRFSIHPLMNMETAHLLYYYYLFIFLYMPGGRWGSRFPLRGRWSKNVLRSLF